LLTMPSPQTSTTHRWFRHTIGRGFRKLPDRSPKTVIPAFCVIHHNLNARAQQRNAHLWLVPATLWAGQCKHTWSLVHLERSHRSEVTRVSRLSFLQLRAWQRSRIAAITNSLCVPLSLWSLARSVQV
jgi:hypothetical protein